MSKVKIFARPLEDIEVLEYHINKFLETIKLVDIKTEIGKNKYQEDIFIITVIYEEKA
jgi:hypothetical protein